MKLLNKCIHLFILGVKIKAINGLNIVYSCIHEQNKITIHWKIYHKIQIYISLTCHSWNNLKHLLLKVSLKKIKKPLIKGQQFLLKRKVNNSVENNKTFLSERSLLTMNNNLFFQLIKCLNYKELFQMFGFVLT